MRELINKAVHRFELLPNPIKIAAYNVVAGFITLATIKLEALPNGDFTFVVQAGINILLYLSIKIIDLKRKANEERP